MALPALTLPPLSLYVHVPWCIRKCPYCDFNSHQRPQVLPEADYINALLEDLQQDLSLVQGRELVSIFIGGGTPSLFSAASFDTLLRAIEALIPFRTDIEITLEANPGTFEQDKFSAYRQTGINRLSIGVQSFDPHYLQLLGRVHGREEALRAADIARRAGFDNFNLDLMFGLPEQSTSRALADLEQAIACEPTHVSWYQLTLEPNTEFYKRPPVLPEDDALADMQEAGFARLAASGFERYEVSAFSQPGRAAHHNTHYWEFGDYLGIGAGAHGKLTLPESSAVIRTRKTRMPAHYLQSPLTRMAEQHQVPVTELPLEFMMNALRLNAGVPLALYPARTGLEPDPAVLETLRSRGLLALQPDRLQATARGLQHLNAVLEEFL